MAIKQLNTTISQSPEGKSIAKIREIRGNTLVWNQLVSATGNASGFTLDTTVTTEKKYVLTGTVPSASVRCIFINNSAVIPTDHKALVVVKFKTNFTGRPYFRFATTTSQTWENIEISSYTKDVWITAAKITNGCYLNVNAGFLATGGYNANEYISLPLDGGIQVFDLTLMFGAGNEPSTFAEFEAMFPNDYYPHNTGTLINVGGKVTLNWNQLLSVTGGTLISATKSITNDNIIILTKNTASGSGSGGMLKYTNFTISPSHKYYISANVLSVFGDTFYIHFGVSSTISTNKALTWNAGESGKKSMITSPITNSNELDFRIGASVSSSGVTAKFKDILCVDLTQAFGAGYEPKTPEEFELLFPESYYPYNAGTNNTYSFSPCIETVGFNQWDEEWEYKGMNAQGQKTDASDNRFISKNFIPVIPGAEYYLKLMGSGVTSYQLFWYDSNKNFVSYQTSRYTNIIYTIPSSASFMMFQVLGTSTYSNDICINISNTSKNGVYEPYKKSILPLNISTLTGKLNGEGESVTIVPDGLKSAGTVYDYGIVEDGYLTKVVKCIGEVDMGTLYWQPSSDYACFFVNQNYLPSDFNKALLNTVAINSKYEGMSSLTADPRNMRDKVMMPYNGYLGQYLLTKDSTYTYDSTGANSLKSSLSGQLLYYELATHQTYVLDTPIYVGYETGTEKIAPSNILQAPLIADIDYFDDAIKHIQFDGEKHCIRDERILGIDSEPTESSNNVITSGGVYDVIRNKKPLYTKTYTYKCAAATEAEGYIYFMNMTPTSNEWATPWTVHYTLTVDCDTSEDANAKYCHGDYDVFIGCAGNNYYYHIFNKFYSSSYYPIYYHKLIYHNTEAKYNSYRDSHPAKVGVRVLSAWGASTRTRKYTIKVYDYKNCVISFPDNIENHTTAYSSTYNSVIDFNATSTGLQETGDANTLNHYNYEYYVGYRVHGTDTPLYRYKFVGFDNRNRIVPITITNQTDSNIINKTACSVPMTVSNGLALYNTTTAITDATTAVATGTIYRNTSITSGILQYNLSESVGRSSNSTTSREIYLVGTYDVNTDEFTLDASSYTSFYKVVAILQSESDYYANFTNGKYYWYLGQCPTSDNIFNFTQHHPLFYFNGTKLIEVKSKAISEKEDKSNKTTSLSASSTDTQYPSAAAVVSYVGNYVDTALTSALKYKGTVASNSALPATHEVGWVYVVSTAGTFAGKACEVGDYIICKTAGTSANNAHWDVINGENQVENKSASLAAAGSSATIATVDGTNLTVTTPSTWTGVAKTGTVTSITLSATSPIVIDNSAAITTSGSRTFSHATSGVTAGTYKSVTVDAKGHVTAGTNPTTLAGYGITDAAPAVSGGYLPLSGGVMQDGATIKLKQYSGERTLTLSGNSVFHDLSTATGGYAGSFYSIRTKGTDNELYTTTGLGFYGGTSAEKGLYHLYFAAPGETYTDPSIKVTVDGLATFKNQVTAAGFKTPSGTSSQFLKADGSVDSNTYSLSSHTHSYLPLSGGTMTGVIERQYDSASNVPVLKIGSKNQDIQIFKVYSSDISNYTDTVSGYGYSLQYNGQGTGVSNHLRLIADNQVSTNSKKTAISVNQSGQVGILADPNTSYALYVNGNTNINGDVTATTIKKSGGTSSQFLKADGSVDSNTYLTSYTDTKNTAGSTDSSSKLFIIGATSQAANPQTYSQDTAYVGTDGHLYSNSKQVVNLSDTQALTNKTYNGYTLADACAKAVVTTVDSGASLPTSGAVKTFVENKGYVTTDTKNTAGSTDTSSKIFLIGATSQAANPQTYSDNEVYATSGVLTTRSVQVGGTAATMQYNSTDNSIEFVFG